MSGPFCLESQDVIRERYDRRQRVWTFWLTLTLVIATAALIWEVTR